jgi:ABC-type bacteriocin/lantibiotic exporter with double-glycine peptidase domain
MFTIIGKLFDLLSSKEKVQLYFIFAALVGLAIIEMAGIASIMPFMAVVARPEVVESNRWLKQTYDFLGFSSPKSFLSFLGLLVLGLLIFSNLFKALAAWLTLRYDNRLNYMLARRLLAQYLARPYAFFLNRNTADMGKNVLTEVRTVISGVLSHGMQMLSNILVSLLILALLLAVDPLVAVTIAIVLGGIYVLLYLFVRRRLSRIGKEQVVANSMKYKAASEALSGIKDLKILGRERVFLERFAVHARRHSRNNVTAGIISLVPRYTLEILAFGGILIIVLHFLGEERGAGQMVPLLALYSFAGYRLMPAMQNVFVNLAMVRFSLASLDILHADLTEGLNGADPERLLVKPANIQPLPFTKEFELRDVNFCYFGAQEPVLTGLNLTIPVNSTIGFVGATGSGKTTAVDIILGLLTPLSGKLLADGIEINEHNLARWQRNLGYVPQNIYLCDDTLTRNIAFGVPESEIDMEAVVRAARIANLDDFVKNELPEGYETVIGERGVRLSGGQRQRIGIARALYHDPAVLILDEATSALDGITEEAVMDAIRNLSRKKTIVMIAHRLTTVKDSDLIYILEHGKIVEYGSYNDLQISSEWFRTASGAGTSVVS